MKVILLQNIKGVGRMGDIKVVADGYGRNYLLPNKLARPASDGTVKEAEQLKQKAEAQEAIKLETADKIATQVKDINIEFSRKASSTGTLFASVTKEDIAQELARKVGAKIQSEMIDLTDHEGHIKHLGEHIIDIELMPEKKVKITVSVVSQK